MPRKYVLCSVCRTAYLESEVHYCDKDKGAVISGNTITHTPNEGIRVVGDTAKIVITGNTDTNYYSGDVEPIDLIEAQGLGFHEGNIVKYICRYKRKGGLDDLRKAWDYLDRLVKREEEKADSGK